MEANGGDDNIESESNTESTGKVPLIKIKSFMKPLKKHNLINIKSLDASDV